METEESQNIDLLDFQKIGKKSGEPYDILDDKIAEYITQKQLRVIILNGVPYLYRRGYYLRDEDGKVLKAHIKALIWPELVTIGRINRVYNLILADYRLTKLYESYCIFNQWTPLSSRSFYKNLRGKGYRDYPSNKRRYFKDMCTQSALTVQERADFRQATLEENAVFAENNLK